jgi:CelD/BcsL family acetyltransferase involved in cellulose biosynthesis
MQAVEATDGVAGRHSRQPLVLSGAAPSTVYVAIVPLAEADARIGAEWNDLAVNAAEPNAFAERWFFMASVRNLPIPTALRLVTVWAGTQLIGLVPLTIGSRYGRMRVRHVVNWQHHHDFLGVPLMRRGHEAVFWAALIGLLDGADWAPGFLHLTGLVEGGPAHRGLVAAAEAIGRRCDIVHRVHRAQLDAGLDPDEYYRDNVRKKKRKELKRLAVRLAEQGTIETRRLTRADEVTNWGKHFLALERSGWKGRAGSALASRADTAAFFRDMLAGAHAAGRLDILRMDLDGHPVAMLANFITPPGAFSFKIAFDEDYARFSPGVLVQIENLQILRRGDVAWMDSCAAENHPMIDSLWSGRRSIVRVTLPLAGWRRGATFRVCRAAETSWARVRGRKS